MRFLQAIAGLALLKTDVSRLMMVDLGNGNTNLDAKRLVESC